MDYLHEVKLFHTQHIEPYTGPAVGCSRHDVTMLEQQIGFSLPTAYTQYLLWIGRDYRGIFQGSDWFINNVVERTSSLPVLLAENHISAVLPDHYLVFFAHQGYMMAWFELPKQSDNPLAYFFGEGQDLVAPRVEGTFTKVLFNDMRGLASILPTLHR